MFKYTIIRPQDRAQIGASLNKNGSYITRKRKTPGTPNVHTQFILGWLVCGLLQGKHFRSYPLSPFFESILDCLFRFLSRLFTTTESMCHCWWTVCPRGHHQLGSFNAYIWGVHSWLPLRFYLMFNECSNIKSTFSCYKYDYWGDALSYLIYHLHYKQAVNKILQISNLFQ